MSSQLWQLKLKEGMCKAEGTMAYIKDLLSEFLTPSRRSHPHVEPLLAPYNFLDKASKGLICFTSQQGMHFP